MADVNANIGVGINTSDALSQLKALQRQISQFHSSIAKSSAAAASAQQGLQKNFINSVNSIGAFSAELKTVKTSSETFTNSLEKNKFSMREYFRYSAAATKTFGKGFVSEFSTIEKVAVERVKTLQTQYIKMGRDAQGAMQAIAVRPAILNMQDLGTKTAVAAQKQALFNQLVKQGSTNLLNFGKNTQWAGRQLMVGFTLPLATLGTVAAKTFMEMEAQVIKFKKVYGDLFTPTDEREKALKEIQALAEGFTKYGIAAKDVVGVAAEAAAAGFAGIDLQRQTEQAIRLSVLGQVDYQKSLETTISLQNAFQMSSEELAGSIDFLNAVENQTVLSLDDVTIAIPKVAPVIKALGGDVRDLAFFLTAMKEGGINASEGANALKSGLASLINPTTAATAMLGSLGVNIKGIVSANAGDVKGIILDFAEALDELNPTQRAQAIEQMFGKFQFARLSTLFANVVRDGNQASRVLDLAEASMGDLAAMAESELGVTAASSMNKFLKVVQDLKIALVPIGETFLEVVTPVLDGISKIASGFNKLPDGTKAVITGIVAAIAGLGPIILMTFGLLANGIANAIKFGMLLRTGYLKLTGQTQILGAETQYLTTEQLQAAAAAASLDQAHAALTQRFTVEKEAVDRLRIAYQKAMEAGLKFAKINPNMMQTAPMTQAKGYASGVVSVPGPRGAGDVVPAMLSPGEAVIPSKMAQKYSGLIEGMIAGNIPGYAKGVQLGMPRSGKSTQRNREASEEIYQRFLQSSYANTPPTEYGHQISPTSGHSFPIFGLGGVYAKGGQKVFVKPVMDEAGAMAEMRGTQIARQAHGLEAPEQRIVVIRDPQDVTRQRRFLALESDLDAKFVNSQPNAIFNEEQYFKQLVASLLRVDKDLSAGNVFGNVVADAGPSGVFNRASGVRALQEDLPSMEEQAMVNLLGIKGGAKRAFAESTVGLMSKMSAEQYNQYMIAEIQRVIPNLKKTVADFGLTNPSEAGAYTAMISRLQKGLGVDWRAFHKIHSAVKPSKPKQSTNAIPGYANGIVSVPGPKGAGDVTPAMLSPGEAVIPAKMAKKYAPLVQGMIAGNIPGFELGTLGAANIKFAEEIKIFPEIASAIKATVREIEASSQKLSQSKALQQLEEAIMPIVKLARSSIQYNVPRGNSANSGANLSHLVPFMHMDQEQANKAGRDLIAAGTNTEPSRYMAGATRPVKAVSNLVASLPRQANDPAGSMNAADTARWIKEEKERFVSFVYENYAKGAGVQSNDPELMKFAASISDAMQAAGTDAMKDPQLYSVVKEAISSMLEGAAKDAVMQAASEFSTIEMAGSDGKKMRRAAIGGKSALTPLGERTDFAGGQGFTSESVGVIDAQAGSYKRYGQTKAGKSLVQEQNTGADEFLVKILRERVSKILKSGLGTASPSQEFAEIARDVSAGVRLGKDDAVKAGKEIGNTVSKNAMFSGTSFKKPVAPSQSQEFPKSQIPLPNPSQAMKVAQDAGQITMGPLQAYFRVVGANLKNVVSDFKEEMGIASSTSMGPIKAYATVVGSNLREAFQDTKQELAGVFGRTSGVISDVSQGIERANKKVIVAGKEYTRNFIADAQGRDGAIEAVVTRNTAELVSKINTNLKNGFGKIPPIVAVELTKTNKEFLKRMQAMKITTVNEEINRGKALVAAQKITTKASVEAAIQKQTPSVQGRASIDPSRATTALQGFNSKLMQGSFAVSSLAGIASMAGGAIGEAGQAMFGLTSLLFGLSGITEVLTRLGVAEAAIKRLNLVSSTVSAKGLAGGFQIVTKFLGVFGFAIAGLAIVVPLLAKAIIEQREKVTGLGSAAFLTGEKLKTLASDFGVSLKSIDFTTGFRESGSSSSEQVQTARAAASGDGKEFKAKFKAEIAGIKNATLEQAQQAMDALALNLANTGFEEEAVKEIIGQIALLAGRTDLKLSFKGLKIEGTESLAGIQDYISKLKEFVDSVDTQSANTFGTDIAVIAGSAASGLTALRAAFDDGKINAQEFTTGINDISNAVNNLPPHMSTLGITGKLAEMMGIGELLDGLRDVDARMTLIGAAAAGINIDPEDLEAMIKASKNTRDPNNKKILLALTEKYNKAIAIETKATEDNTAARNESTKATELYNENYTKSIENIDAQIEAAELEISTYARLVESGMAAADAIKFVSDANLMSAFNAAANATEQQGVIDKFKELQGLLAESPIAASRVTGGGGGGTKSKFQEAKESLTKARQEVKNTILAYNKLRDSGFSVNSAFKAASDSVLAAALATTKPNSAKWKDLVALIRKANIDAKKLERLEIKIKVQADFGSFFSELSSQANEYFDILERKTNQKYRDRISAEQKAIEAAEKEITAFQDAISLKERTIEIDFDRPAGLLQEESSKLSNDLTIIDNKSKAITEKYDNQKSALENINKLNQEIINKQKSQVSLADALSQGDISSAAKLMQDMRGQSAAAAAGSLGQALDAARQSELNSLTGPSGLNKAQIEQRQYDIGQLVFDLEAKKAVVVREIRDLQDKTYDVETKTLAEAKNRMIVLEGLRDLELETIDAQRQKFEDAQLAIDLARIKAGKFNDVIKVGKLLVGDILSNWNDIKTKTIQLIIQEVRIPASGGSGAGSGSTPTANPKVTQKVTPAPVALPPKAGASGGGTGKGFQLRMYGGAIKKMATGGIVSGTGMGDVVPAMLTPGEFVVNKSSSKQFMPMLKSMNDGKFPAVLRNMITPAETSINVKSSNLGNWKNLSASSEIQRPLVSRPTNVSQNTSVSSTSTQNPVYNYSLSVNVSGGSSMNADTLASTVISRIKQMDSQRVRGKGI